jgi:hypothetical protein
MNSFGSASRRLRVLCFVAALFVLPVARLVSAQTLQSKSIRFTDVTEKAGIRFTHFKGNNGISINLEEFGPGVCVSDFDGDGWQDIYFVNGRDRYGRDIKVSNALYRNNRNRLHHESLCLCIAAIFSDLQPMNHQNFGDVR